MKTKLLKMFILNILLIVVSGFFIGCDKDDDNPVNGGEHHGAEVEFTYSPNPAIVNTEIELLFEVEEDGEHVDVMNFECEIELEGSGNHVEVELHADDDEPGHYHGAHTFTEAGNYEVHFKFMHDDEEDEKAFEIEIVGS